MDLIHWHSTVWGRMRISTLWSVRSRRPEFIVTIQTNEPVKAEEICETELGADVTFDATVARVTAAENRRAGCTGEPPVDDAESLLRLKRAYFLSLEAVPPIGTFANGGAPSCGVIGQ
jgi:hypothetical protein